MSKQQQNPISNRTLTMIFLALCLAPLVSAPAAAEDATTSAVVAAATNELHIVPSSAALAVGEVRGFDVLGAAVTPLTWTTTDSDVATIDSDGNLRAATIGSCRVRVEDSAGAVGHSGLIHVTSLSVTAPSGTIPNDRQPYALTLRIDGNVASSSIRAINLEISFDETVLEAVDATSSGSITETWGAPSFSAGPGWARVSHAGSASLSGPGGLLAIEFRSGEGVPDQSGSTIEIHSIRLNEGEITARSIPGTVSVDGEPIDIDSVIVSPGGGELSLGSTRQFTATVTGSGPATVTWEIVEGAGVIDDNGIYAAPYTMPEMDTVTIQATSTVEPDEWGQAHITLIAPGAAAPLQLFALKNPGRDRALTLYVTSSESISGSPTLTAAGQPVPLVRIGQSPDIYRGSLVVESANSIQLTAQATTGSGAQSASTTVYFGG